MENNYITLNEVMSFFKKVFIYGLSKWKLLFITGLIGGIIGFGYASFQKANYFAKFSFLLNENDGAPSLNISSLAGLAGIGIGGAGGNINEDKLLFIAYSRNLIGKTLLDKAIINSKNTTLINHFIDIYELQGNFQSDTALKDFTYFTNTKLDSLSYKENKILDMIVQGIVDGKKLKIEGKKKSGLVAQSSGIITIEFESINELFAKYFIENLYTNICNYYTKKTISKQLRTYNAIKERADSIKNVLFSKESYGANIFDRNVKVIRMEGRLDIERTKRDVEMLSLMYAEVLKNQEVAKFALDNQTPFFQTVDTPTLPLYKQKLSRLKSAIVVSILLSILIFSGSFIKNYNNINND